ncbi:tetraacyldisaccharide 4'-kinase [Halopseudomonas pelagia]|uniref:tetraacyldisaccharide 4'-kinase n=1 Tax=Halopseudomonas pelagia TaxID=553151 RepID=UPI0003A8BED7|nr:tetraacyldisaccharide 4'-kinase [Halopseudomonas pelagia]
MLRAWYQSSPWLRLLRPLSVLYAAVASRRRQRFLSDPSLVWRAPVPVIVVGNITLGGTGKTPMCIWLICYLQSLGLRPGVISRGYGANKVVGFPHLIAPLIDQPGEVGDEPLLIARRCAVPVVIDPDRPAAARHLLANADVDVIISDDGLQHYALGRDVEILMLDAARGLGNARCLPEGPLREPARRLASVDLVVSNGLAADTAGTFAMQLAPTELVNLRSGERLAPQSWRAGREVEAIAGIGNPQRFFSTLEGLSLQPHGHAFPDHAQYTVDSFAACDPAKPLIMTEKDAIKCAGFARDNWWYLSIDASLGDAFVSALQQRLDGLPD